MILLLAGCASSAEWAVQRPEDGSFEVLMPPGAVQSGKDPGMVVAELPGGVWVSAYHREDFPLPLDAPPAVRLEAAIYGSSSHEFLMYEGLYAADVVSSLGGNTTYSRVLLAPEGCYQLDVVARPGDAQAEGYRRRLRESFKLVRQ